jgi:hypothetical protein
MDNRVPMPSSARRRVEGLRASGRLAALAGVIMVSGCSFASDSLWPSLTGGEPSGATESIRIAPADVEFSDDAMAMTEPPALGTTTFEPMRVTQAVSTGTFVGGKVQQLRGELGAMQGQIVKRNGELQQMRNIAAQNSQRYHGTVAAITTRLQMGTTPGNPVLVQQWNAAQAELDRIGLDITAMNSLANKVASDSAMAAFLLESARAAYGLAGAIDEDHRQLAILEDETNRTVVQIDRLLNELSEDVSRQTTYVGSERSTLTALSLAIQNGEILGPSLANRAFTTAAPISSRAPDAGSGGSFALANRRPLVVIRFDRPDPPYEQALYTAVSRAIERRPDALFDLVAVAPAQGSAADAALGGSKAKKYAGNVLRALTQMGLPASRVSLSAATSGDAVTPEVHLYVR